jgi:hypothetical protein
MIGSGNRSTRRKPAPMLFCPPQTPYAARTRTRAAAVGSQRLTAWATARPLYVYICMHVITYVGCTHICLYVHVYVQNVWVYVNVCLCMNIYSRFFLSSFIFLSIHYLFLPFLCSSLSYSSLSFTFLLFTLSIFLVSSFYWFLWNFLSLLYESLSPSSPFSVLYIPRLLFKCAASALLCISRQLTSQRFHYVTTERCSWCNVKPGNLATIKGIDVFPTINFVDAKW